MSVTHGKTSTWRDGCRCARCEWARAVELKRRSDPNSKRGLIPAVSTRLIINELMDVRHWTLSEISARVWLSMTTISNVRNGQQNLIRKSNHRLFVDLMRTNPVAHRRRCNNTLMESKLTRDALRGLHAQGYEFRWISRQLGKGERWADHLANFSKSSGPYLRWNIEDRVIALCREVGSTPGPSNAARLRAQRRGWKPTMYVDELV